MESKQCNKCGQVKDLSEFRIRHKHKKGKEYIFPAGSCIECEHKESAEGYKRRMSNPEYAEYRKVKVYQHIEKFRQSDKYTDRLRIAREYNASKPQSCRIYVATCRITGKLFIAQNKNAQLSHEGELEIGRIRSRVLNFADGSNIRHCVICNKEYDFLIEGSTAYCSIKCKKQAKRETSKINKKVRRARKHTNLYESVNPVKVFNRDRWICKLCGIKTPKRMRGTIAPNAPELDHIVPLSKGGQHTYSNVQCLCRSCNSNKHDKLIGQLTLCI